jgi:hypothetical protein
MKFYIDANEKYLFFGTGGMKEHTGPFRAIESSLVLSLYGVEVLNKAIIKRKIKL